MSETKFFSQVLPADVKTSNEIRKVSDACFSWVQPLQPEQPRLVHYNAEYAKELGIEFSEKEAKAIFSGQQDYPNQRPYAMCYGGHQFGQWAGQLGDGRAINIAEIETPLGGKTLQLKGAGPTPYSRSADGLAVLRSSIREYLCSEAMYHLGVPTTRALSLSLSGNQVMRDVLYNGNPALEPGAIVCRVSSSFVRFGSFEILAARKEHHHLKSLLDFVIEQYYPNLGTPAKDTYVKFFQELMERTLEMIIHWERVGFVHGVMNTDNMSILGETIDYGPYGWLEDFDPTWTPNTTDAQGRRYRFGNQAAIALWNLNKLGSAIYPLIGEAEPLENSLNQFKKLYFTQREKMYCEKLGVTYGSDEAAALVEQILILLEKSSMDMTMFWRRLADVKANSPEGHLHTLAQQTYLEKEEFEQYQEEWKQWLTKYGALVLQEGEAASVRKQKMNAVNPKYVLRNYMAQLAIEAAEQNDFSLVDELFEILQHPYEEQEQYEKWFAKRPDWALNKVGCSMLSCSS
ncbi:Uncharacterized conserved protein YdiU, UPF0061 family [Lishizhenia tianjinensis]|uniref:Protein nucleotidyltransferase YdiU n=1 Tax=Lishizhenia tianjinensis TaxID=477690 RepID=A0A1I7AHM5_9FLAO|nr:YdiU family protein [Lishizhenia tianjinensis]SFT74456.1 Uncharacterized conserved protein YdiU, UPF0061 family [Lishizhenia tianjinensis]